MADEQKVILVEIDIDVESAVNASVELRKQIKTLEDETKAMKGTEKELSAEYVNKTAQLKNMKADLSANEKAIQKISTANETQVGTLKRLRAENSALAAERENLNLATEEGASRLDEINQKIDENNKLIKESSDKTSQAKQNVGNYSESIQDALGSLDAFKGGQGNVINNFISISQQEGGIKSFFGTFVSGIGSATKAGLAFIATPIGAVIAAIVAVIGLFTSAINNNDEASEGWGKTWSGITAVIDVVIGRITKLAKGVWDFLTGDFKGAAENFAGAFTGIGDAMMAAYEAGQQLYMMQLQLESMQVHSISTIANLAAKEKALSLAADDNTKSLQERTLATIELQKVQEEQAKIAQAIAWQELKIEAAKFRAAKQNGIDAKEARKAFLEVEAKYKEAEANTTGVIAENAKKRREIRKDQLNRELDLLIDGFDSVKTINEKIIASEKETFDFRQKKLEETKRLSDESFNAQIRAIEKAYNIYIDKEKLIKETDAAKLNRMILEMKLADDIHGRVLEIFKERKMATADLQQAEIDLSKARTDAAIENMNFEVSMFKLQNQSKLEGQKKITAEMIKDEEARLRSIAGKEFAANEATFSEKMRLNKNDIAAQHAYDLQKVQLETDLNNSISTLNREFEESERQRKLEAQATDFENQMALAQSNVFAELDLQSDKLAMEAEQELMQADLTGAEKALIYEKWAKAEEEIERRKTEAKLELAAGFAGNLKTIFGESTAIGKAAAVAETTINTYKAATSAYSAMAGIPYVGPVLGIAAAAAAVTAGLANVKKILAVKNPNGSDKGLGGAPVAGGTTVSAPRASVNPEIGKGIVSRDSSTGTSASIQAGVQNGMAGVSLQPVLVVDNVTAKQNQANNNNAVATI